VTDVIGSCGHFRSFLLFCGNKFDLCLSTEGYSATFGEFSVDLVPNDSKSRGLKLEFDKDTVGPHHCTFYSGLIR